MVALVPAGAMLPVLAEVSSSDSVLAVGSRDGASACAPGAGLRPLSKPCSPALLGL